jgi:hypothetical protein
LSERALIWLRYIGDEPAVGQAVYFVDALSVSTRGRSRVGIAKRTLNGLVRVSVYPDAARFTVDPTGAIDARLRPAPLLEAVG